MNRCSPNFNPRAPCGARHAAEHGVGAVVLISILAPLAGRDQLTASASVSNSGISILAPLAGRDHAIGQQPVSGQGISILAPLAGRDG